MTNKSSPEKLIFFTDTHNNNIDTPPLFPSGFSMMGTKAPLMLRALFGYGHREGISLYINGGDDETYCADPLEHEARADEMTAIMDTCGGDVIRLFGNHAIESRFAQFASNGFNRAAAKHGFNVHVTQPEIRHVNGYMYFHHPEDMYKGISQKPISDSGIIGVTHFPVDAMDQGYPKAYPDASQSGYSYIETREKGLAGYIADMQSHAAEEGAPRSYLATANNLFLHGHTHSFKMTPDGNFLSVTIPALTREDELRSGEPCGTFVEIEKSKTGYLLLGFKQVVLNENNPEKSEVIDIEPDDLHRHYKRRTPIKSAAPAVH